MNKAKNLMVGKPYNPKPSLDEINGMIERLSLIRERLLTESIRVGFHVPFSERTAVFEFFDAIGLTPNNLSLLQTQLEGQFADWRVYVQCSTPEDSIVIYPTEIAFSSSVASPTDELEQIRHRQIQYQDSHRGVHDRQIKYVTQLLESLRLPEKPYPPIVLATFDSYRGDFDLVSVWVITDRYTKAGENWLPMEETDEDGFAGSADSFDISQDMKLADAFSLGKLQLGGHLQCNVYRRAFFKQQILTFDPASRARSMIPTGIPISDSEVKHQLSRTR